MRLRTVLERSFLRRSSESFTANFQLWPFFTSVPRISLLYFRKRAQRMYLRTVYKRSDVFNVLSNSNIITYIVSIWMNGVLFNAYAINFPSKRAWNVLFSCEYPALGYFRRAFLKPRKCYRWRVLRQILLFDRNSKTLDVFSELYRSCKSLNLIDSIQWRVYLWAVEAIASGPSIDK